MITKKALRQSNQVRGASLIVLRSSESVVRIARVLNERALTHLQMRLHVWQLALDPSTRPWIADARRQIADGTAEAGAGDPGEVQQRIKELRAQIG